MAKKKKEIVKEEGLPLVEEVSIEAEDSSIIEEMPIEEKIEESKPRMSKGDYYSKLINGGK